MAEKKSAKVSKLDLVIVGLVLLLGLTALVPIFKKPEDVLVKQAHQQERLQLNTQIELYSMDNDGVYPKSMIPAEWLEYEKYFPEISQSDAAKPLYCNQGSAWELGADHRLLMAGHGTHE